jgi:hypothetical protein
VPRATSRGTGLRIASTRDLQPGLPKIADWCGILGRAVRREFQLALPMLDA